jgi:5'-nucleotidase
VAGLRPEYGVVVSGHTHRFYSCALPNSSGANSVVTSAGANGTLVTDIKMKLDKRTKRFVEASARNQIVENGVRTPDGTGWVQNPDGSFVRNPDTADPRVKVIADKYRTAVAPIANRVVGTITADIVRDVTPASNQESPLGDVIADAQLRYTQSAGAQIALMNPGGIRASLIFSTSPGGEAPGQVTYGEAFTVQPFNNLVVTQTLTGAQIKAVLEQQFPIVNNQQILRILQVSAGFSYTYNSTLPAGSRISNIALNGTPIDPAASYRVTTNDFLANGGDGFTELTGGTNRVTAPGFDVDALVAYLGAAPVSPTPANRITRTG